MTNIKEQEDDKDDELPSDTNEDVLSQSNRKHVSLQFDEANQVTDFVINISDMEIMDIKNIKLLILRIEA